MSASAKLRRLYGDGEYNYPYDRRDILEDALLAIIAVVEAAEQILPGPYVSDEGPAAVPMKDVIAFHDTLAALDAALH